MHEESFFGDPKNWVMLAFFLFFILFGKKIWGALSGILDARGVAIKAEIEEANRLRAEAEAMLADAQKQRADALAEATALIAGAQAEASRMAAAAAAEAEAAAKRRERMAIERIAAAEKAAVDDVRLAAADVATLAAKTVLAEGFSAEADAGLIDQAIAQLPAALRAA